MYYYHDHTSDSSSSSSEDEQAIVLRRQKIYRPRTQYLTEYDDVEFFDRFRLTKPTVLALLQQIVAELDSPTNRGGKITLLDQLLLALRFYASGNMLIGVADFIGVSRSSASKIVQKVSRVMASLRPQYIKFYETEAEMDIAAQEFHAIASFPRTIGAIDGTLIRINSPGGVDAEIYRCRKSYFSLNVQTVSDANLKIKDIVARWPVLSLKRQFENGRYGRFLLIGHSGYTLEPYLMTKVHATRTPAENLYNESIIRTRNVVERQYGVWKRRFPILSTGMKVKLRTVM
ncbi:hypothetical protein RI129_001475 [Pyrocoelia pectoralis]|uniref:DDE Tnp4 domain-containing protein n=1 Tax=Pyrocoelia pectoralis TaxID=417401 RepID=A0AAN7VUV8_9COLE